MRSVDIFPWNDHFNTGLPEVDHQHRVLVGLLNGLASHMAFAKDLSALNRVLDELTEYAIYHFSSEERIWNRYMSADNEKVLHRMWHDNFVAAIDRLKAKQASKPLPQVVDETLAYLARWLIRHILEQDHYAARVVHGLHSGQEPDEARQQARAGMQHTGLAMLDMILTIYGALAANTVNLLREIAERERIESSLHESEERFRLVVERAPIGILLGRDGILLDANAACARMFGYPDPSTLRGTSLFHLAAPASRQDIMERHSRRMRRGSDEDAERYETVGLRRDGSEFPVLIAPASVRLSGGPTVAVFLIDITERKRAEENERILTRTVKLLSRANALQLRTTDETALLEGVCRLAVEVGGYCLAWAGYAEHDAEKSVRPVALFGDGADYVRSARVSWGDNPRGQGPGGRAIRSGKPVITRDIQNDPKWEPWREATRASNYQAAIALPLIVEGKTIGLIAILSHSVDAFREEELKLLDELASDLAFGIQSLRLRAAKEAALRELKRESDKGRALLHNASDGVHVLDEDGYLIEASDSFFAMLGYTREELMGKHLTTWHVSKESWTELRPLFQEVVHGDTREEFQFQHRRRDGSIIDVSVSTFALTLEGRQVVFNSSRDITESLRIRAQLEHTTEDLRALLADFDSSLEAERTHIAREVHDELGQTLTTLGFAISTLRVKYGEDNPELQTIAREMAVLNDRALQAARNVSENLRPAVLDMGIVPAVEWLCGQIRAQTGLPCEFRASGNLDNMDQTQVDTVFRIAQESLTNALRHAQASRLSISLMLHDDRLHLTAHDDGKGFDPARGARPKSFGLRGMEERVRGLGGAFHVTSAPDAGTMVAVHMPYHRKEVAQ